MGSENNLKASSNRGWGVGGGGGLGWLPYPFPNFKQKLAFPAFSWGNMSPVSRRALTFGACFSAHLPVPHPRKLYINGRLWTLEFQKKYNLSAFTAVAFLWRKKPVARVARDYVELTEYAPQSLMRNYCTSICQNEWMFCCILIQNRKSPIQSKCKYKYNFVFKWLKADRKTSNFFYRKRTSEISHYYRLLH